MGLDEMTKLGENWVLSILIMQTTHPVLSESSAKSYLHPKTMVSAAFCTMQVQNDFPAEDAVWI